jgi:hypothetical protein
MKMKITAGRGHVDPCVTCESLWTLPERITPARQIRDNPAFSAQDSNQG